MQLKHKDFTGAVIKDDTLGERQIRVVVSTPSPDRVKDVMEPGGCTLENYKLNPIVLADHNPKAPIGNAEIQVKSERVEAIITFAPAGISEKADEYCGLAKNGVLNTVSPGFRELDTSPIKGGGVHIKAWELLELSLVAVPANPGAVVIGRSLEKAEPNWKVGASRNLPLSDSAEWDSQAAMMGIFEKAGFDGDDPDTGFARKGFLVYDASNPDDAGSYKYPFAKMVDGRLTVTAKSIKAVAELLSSQTDIPADVAEKARAVIDHYEGQMKDKSAAGMSTKEFNFKRKDLYDCGDLAYVVQRLVSLACGADWERQMEEDDSVLPELLAEIARQAGDALKAMVEEEVAELITRLPGASDEQKAYIGEAKSVVQKALRSAAVADKIKAGRTFSSANEKSMREACKSIMTGHDAIKAMLDDNSADTADEETSETDTGKAMPAALSEREREVEVLRLKAV